MQYPDQITITRKPEFEQDENGNFQASGEATTFTSECRAEIAGNNPEVVGADGNKVQYSWIVYMPKTTENFVFGDKVTITKGSQDFESSLIQQYNGHFNTRLWV